MKDEEGKKGIKAIPPRRPRTNKLLNRDKSEELIKSSSWYRTRDKPITLIDASKEYRIVLTGEYNISLYHKNRKIKEVSKELFQQLILHKINNYKEEPKIFIKTY